ncbi:MAG: hypothetical protein QOG64_1126, partial [Acidimicrobiaceae bacterium]|nr:hypothetical protein [Acidimicrobiaceae bacterium]
MISPAGTGRAVRSASAAGRRAPGAGRRSKIVKRST